MHQLVFFVAAVYHFLWPTCSSNTMAMYDFSRGEIKL